jgi:ATP-dependent helicase/nuclease subunit A
VTLPDETVRARAVTGTDESFLVEASAGTGKTSTLISRIVQHVVADGDPIRAIAAMTFTEKAAGEMKTRLRQALEKVVTSAKNGDAKERAGRALLDLDAAEISTIHSFCARLLRERPVEAGVDPDFVAGDERIAADRADEVFRAWFDRAARRDPGPVADALRAGATPSDIADLAFELHAKRLQLADAQLPADVLEEIRDEIRILRKEWDEILGFFPAEHSKDRKADQIRGALEELRGWSSLGLEELSASRLLTTFNLGHGKRSILDDGQKSRFKAAAERTKHLASRFPSLLLVPLLTALVREIRTSFFNEVEEAKRKDGILDFDDLLLSARDLLRASPAARQHFHEKYRTLMVDEFQDTDPVQAEIVMRLAAAPETQEGAWTDLTPEPGRLFLVGDPKQSIYRFRRADIETYGRARGRFPEASRLPLTSNFRSSRPLLEFVNAVGPTLLPEPRDRDYAVPYAPLEPSDKTTEGTLPAVLFLAAPPAPAGVEETPAEEDGAERGEDDDLSVREEEARAVANLLRARFGGGERPWGRIAILAPRHEAIELLSEALRAAGIPFVLEGGKSFYRREEVAAVVEALKAVDDPSDGIAAVAALKSLLFGISDRVLLDAAESGVRFDRLDLVPEGTPLFPAASLLTRLHRERHGRSAAATLADLLAARQTVAAVESGAVVNPAQGLANLERLLAFVRGGDREGLGFREVVARLVRVQKDPEFEPSAFAEERDAVRLMTLHRAKGLEFDVVVLADFGLKETNRRGGRPSLAFCERAAGRFAVRLRFGPEFVRSARFGEVEESDRLRREEEVRRLLYVGLTRARETLVVSWFRKRTVKENGERTDLLEKSLLFPLAPFETATRELSGLVEVVPPDLTPPAPREAAREVGEPTDLALDMFEAESRIERVRATAARPLRRAGEKDAVLAFTHEDAEPADRDEAPDRARRIGVAVHAAMEALLTRTTVPDAATTRTETKRACEALFEDERREASDLVSELLATPVVARAFAADRRFVEMPILYVDASRPDQPLVEGKIDLLFEEADGWQIVDWKTDRAASPADRLARTELYASQIRAYEEGLRKLLGPAAAVKSGLVVFARPLTA